MNKIHVVDIEIVNAQCYFGMPCFDVRGYGNNISRGDMHRSRACRFALDCGNIRTVYMSVSDGVRCGDWAVPNHVVVQPVDEILKTWSSEPNI